MVVLLHGFGAPGGDLVSLHDAIDPDARFCFPAGRIDLGHQYGGGRAWWRIDMEARTRRVARGETQDPETIPEGLIEAREAVLALLAELRSQHGVSRFVLGGFSQGAMLALDVALRVPHAEVRGVLLMSSTLICRSDWAQLAKLHFARTPVVLSHGERDAVLPCALAQQLRQLLEDAGADVRWVPFVGGHEIPEVVVTAARALLVAR